MNSLPIDRLRSLVRLDNKTGEVIRIASGGSRAKVGMPIGSIAATGYMETKLDGVRLLVHRIAYALHSGSWPTEAVDHINGNRIDNRPDNLRQLSQSLNATNVTKPHSGNTSGLQGVCWNKSKKKWQAQLCVSGQKRVLGVFSKPEDAHEAYCNEKSKHHKLWNKSLTNVKELS